MVYGALWFGGFFVGGYFLAVQLRLMVPTAAAIVFLITIISAKGKVPAHRKEWIAFGVLATALNAWLSWDSWKLYLIQDDAPMGLIPDINAVGCLIMDLLILAIIFSVTSLKCKLTKKK